MGKFMLTIIHTEMLLYPLSASPS